MKNKKTIKELVIEKQDEIKNVNSDNLFVWFKQNIAKTDSKQEWVIFKKTIKEQLGINFVSKNQQILNNNEQLINETDKCIVLYSDGYFKDQRFGITDENGNPLAYGRLFNYVDNQWEAELSSAYKAVYIAKIIKQNNNLESLGLILKTDNEGLTYQDNTKQKGSALTVYATKNNIALKTEWISSNDNRADYYSRKKDYLKFDNTKKYTELIKPFVE